jgi:bifunctional isochorismate lyase / aryl carrier protein
MHDRSQQSALRTGACTEPTTPISYVLPADYPCNTANWTIASERAVLLIHDMQRYFVRAFDHQVPPMSSVVANINRIRLVARKSGCPIVYTAQPGNQHPSVRALLSDFWGPGLTVEANDTDVIAELAPEPRDVQLTKWRYSAFAKTDLRARLAAMDRDQLIVTGVYAHIGCMATALDGFMQDVRVFLVGDAVADLSRRHHEQALEYVASRCGAVVSTADVVAEIDGRTIPGAGVPAALAVGTGERRSSSASGNVA